MAKISECNSAIPQHLKSSDELLQCETPKANKVCSGFEHKNPEYQRVMEESIVDSPIKDKINRIVSKM